MYQKHSIRFKLTDSYIINCANLSLNSLFSLCCYYKLQQYNDKNTNVSKILSSEKTTPLSKNYELEFGCTPALILKSKQ